MPHSHRSTRTSRRCRAAVRRIAAAGFGTAVTLCVALVLFVSPGPVAAAEPTPSLPLNGATARFRLLPSVEPLALWRCDDGAPDRGVALDCARVASREPGGDYRIAAAIQDVAAEADERRPNLLLTSLLSAGVVLGSALNSFLDGSHQSYHFTDEGWFGESTRNGGADKAAHFVDYYIVSKELANLYVVFGHKPEHARWLGFGVSALAGLVTEIGDGTTRHGFSYQDLVMDVGGAAAAALVSALRAEDLVGFRHGFVKTCCAFSSFSSNYDNEIFTADLALVGVARRLGVNIGPLRYLLLSVTYASRGYPDQPESIKQRQVGIEIGLHFKQILDDLRIGRNKWWGYALHAVFDNVRFPYTAVGFQYDLNHGRWHGPGAGNGGYSKP
jgi:hypothetical protein